MVEETEAKQSVLFSRLNGGLMNGAKHAAWKCVAAG